MPATARTHHFPQAPVSIARPPLRAVPTHRRRRLPSAATLALYSLGLTAGFLLAAVASTPGGSAVVAGQLRLAGLGLVVGCLALARARTVTRRHTDARRRAAAM